MTPDAAGAAASPVISYVTTCKGRLEHLKQSLPRLMAQPQAEVVVVDYDCPDGAGAWVEKEWPAARVVRVKNTPLFSAARSRNLGAQAARGEWLCFTDADIVLSADHGRLLTDRLRPGTYFWNAVAPGHILCARSDFLAVAGYDEVLEGWGQEDMDLVTRLDLLGRERQLLPAELFTVIDHGDEVRNRHHQHEANVSNLINGLYCQVKRDMMLEYGEPGLPRAVRQSIYNEARAAVVQVIEQGKPQAAVTVTLPKHRVRLAMGWRIERSWNYVLQPPAARREE